MRSQLHHVAMNTDKFDWYVHFFQHVFAMEIRKQTGEAPRRKAWFFEGIQLNECESGNSNENNVCDHISVAVPVPIQTAKRALSCGCTTLPNGENWIALPNGVAIELMPLE